MASKYNNICVVGDDDQCIYQWRGADINNILDFERDYKNTKVIKLEKNYRSKANILTAANMVIVNNVKRKDKTLKATISEGEKLKVFKADNPEEEAVFICNEIIRIIKSKGYDYGDVGILYRTNAQSRIFEEVFVRNNLPHKILGNLRFYDRKEIKDILAYIRTIINPNDEISLRRIVNEPKRGLGDTTIDKLSEYGDQNGITLFDSMVACLEINTISARTLSKDKEFVEMILEIKEKITLKPSEFIELIIKKVGYLESIKDSKDIKKEGRIENIEELINAAINFENLNHGCTIDDFLENVLLVSEADKYDESSSTVTLMTIHSSKGLEFPVVFMVGMENGIFPSNRSFDDMEEMEEARRLCYVGITRAKDMLYLTYSNSRMVYFESSFGGKNISKPSMRVMSKSKFLREIPENLMINIDYEGNQRHVEKHVFNKFSYTLNIKDEKKFKTNVSKDSVKVGQKVNHEKFGDGMIVKIENNSNDNEDMKLYIAFDNNGIKKMSFSKSPIKFL